MKRWLVGSLLFGLVAPLIVMFLVRAHVKVSPTVAFSVWPTMLVIARGAFGITGRALVAFSVLLNVALYGAFGYITGLISEARRRTKGVPG
jgi:hypothetical protein